MKLPKLSKSSGAIAAFIYMAGTTLYCLTNKKVESLCSSPFLLSQCPPPSVAGRNAASQIGAKKAGDLVPLIDKAGRSLLGVNVGCVDWTGRIRSRIESHVDVLFQGDHTLVR